MVQARGGGLETRWPEPVTAAGPTPDTRGGFSLEPDTHCKLAHHDTCPPVSHIQPREVSCLSLRQDPAAWAGETRMKPHTQERAAGHHRSAAARPRPTAPFAERVWQAPTRPLPGPGSPGGAGAGACPGEGSTAGRPEPGLQLQAAASQAPPWLCSIAPVSVPLCPGPDWDEPDRPRWLSGATTLQAGMGSPLAADAQHAW